MLLSERMELYEVRKTGFASPLSSGEISHLFRVGHLHRRVRCKATGEENWRTIGELFPLLDYSASGYSIPSDETKRGRRLALTFALVATLVAGGAFLYGNRPAPHVGYSGSLPQTTNHEVVAATAARVFRLYSRSAQDFAEAGSGAESRDPQSAAALVVARND